jgi:hypothetical protein
MPIARRHMLQGATATAGLLSIPAIVTRTFADVADAVPLPLRSGEILPDPNFSLLDPTAPYRVGVRPHREGGVCLKLEDEPLAGRYGPKFLIHNYGHGGAGITLSFGCASVVVDHVRTLIRDMRSGMRPSVAVIGSGVIGLTVATELRRKWRHLPITIYAKELDVRKTTSFIAGVSSRHLASVRNMTPTTKRQCWQTISDVRATGSSRFRIHHNRTCMASHLEEITRCAMATMDTITARLTTWCRSVGPAAFPSTGSTPWVVNTEPG